MLYSRYIDLISKYIIPIVKVGLDIINGSFRCFYKKLFQYLRYLIGSVDLSEYLNQDSGTQNGKEQIVSHPDYSESLAQVLFIWTLPRGSDLFNVTSVKLCCSVNYLRVHCFDNFTLQQNTMHCKHAERAIQFAKKPLNQILAKTICNSPRKNSFYITKHYFQDLILSLLFVFCKDCLIQKVKVSAKHRQIFAE